MTDKQFYKPLLTYIIGFFLIFNFGDYQDYRRFIFVIGLLMILNSLIILPYRLSFKWFDSDLRFTLIFLVGIISITGVLIYSKTMYNDNKLATNSTVSKAIVINKEWIGERNGGYQITYSFKANDILIKSKKMVSDFNIGDTLIIKYSNERPELNELMTK